MGKVIRKKILLIVSITVLLISVIFINCGKFSSEKFKDKLDSVIPPESPDFSFTDTIIEISALIDPSMDRENAAGKIDGIISELDKRIGQEGNPNNIISIINDYFFNNLSFCYEKSRDAGKYSEEDLINSYSIEKIISRKQSICMTMSVLYLIVGEKLGIPFYGVVMPGHIYVRYKEKGRSGINIETTYSGWEMYQYGRYSGISVLMEDNSMYGNELRHYLVLAPYLNNIGAAYRFLKKYEKAEAFCGKALEMLPGLPEHHLGLAVVYADQNKMQQALETAETALSMFPESCSVHLFMSAVYLEQKKFTLSKDFAQKALKLGAGQEKVSAAVEKILEEIEKENKSGP